MQRVGRWLLTTAMLGLAALPGACNDESLPAMKAPTEEGAKSSPYKDYAIHLYVDKDGERQRLDIAAPRPMKVASGGASSASSTLAVASGGPANGPLTSISPGDAGVVDAEETFDDHILIKRAVQQCDKRVSAEGVPAPPGPVADPWLGDTDQRDFWHVFRPLPIGDGVQGYSCAYRGAIAQLLLCAADKLAAIAEPWRIPRSLEPLRTIPPSPTLKAVLDDLENHVSVARW